MNPFNLEAALAGAKVVTRDGRDVKIAGYSKDARDGQNLAGWVDGALVCWFHDGSYSSAFDRTHPYDLFMAATERKEWIVRMSTANVVCGPYSSIEQANEVVKKFEDPCTIHEITITE